MRTNEIKNETDDIKKWNEKIKRKDLRYESDKYIFDFHQYDTIRSFGDNIFTDKINIDEAEMDQTNLLKNWEQFSENSKPRTKKDKDKKEILLV